MRPVSSFAGLGIAIFLLALGVAPATAWGEGSPRLRFKAGNGYRIAIEGRGPAAILEVTHDDGPHRRAGEVSTYVAHGAVSAAAIQVRFGDLGSVDVRFRPSGKVTRGAPVQHCKGPDRRIVRYGVFVGHIRFRGEGGYTSARIHRVKGQVLTRISFSCEVSAYLQRHPGKQAGKPTPKEAKETKLLAGFKSGVTATYFEAITTRAGETRFVAVNERTEGSLGLYRVAFAKASPLTFAFDSALSFGSVTPPAPFSGSASLRRAADGTKAWAGTLAVSFPGEPGVALTGAKFKAQLAQSW
ncbi:MAG TPA: hypothetical protein VII45_00050 [Solirubrobacterales bacterium]